MGASEAATMQRGKSTYGTKVSIGILEHGLLLEPGVCQWGDVAREDRLGRGLDGDIRRVGL